MCSNHNVCVRERYSCWRSIGVGIERSKLACASVRDGKKEHDKSRQTMERKLIFSNFFAEHSVCQVLGRYGWKALVRSRKSANALRNLQVYL